MSQVGDLWLLGRHRVYCGSALEAAAYATLMGRNGRRWSLPTRPTTCRSTATRAASARSTTRLRDGLGRDGRAEFTAFLGQASPLLAGIQRRRLAPLRLHGLAAHDELLAAGRDAYTELKNLCVWVKDNGGMGSLYRSQHEFVFVFKHGRDAHRNNVQLGQFGRNRSNVWRYPGVTRSRASREEGNLLALHPTVKPVAMVADAILDCTARGDIVLDGFLGSGTTVIAAERTGRRCYGIELDPAYVDTIVRRWQALTGDHARHAASGRIFDDLAREAEAADAA